MSGFFLRLRFLEEGLGVFILIIYLYIQSNPINPDTEGAIESGHMY